MHHHRVQTRRCRVEHGLRGLSFGLGIAAGHRVGGKGAYFAHHAHVLALGDGVDAADVH